MFEEEWQVMQIAPSAVFPATPLLSLLVCVVCKDRETLGWASSTKKKKSPGGGWGLGLSCQPQDLPEVNDPQTQCGVIRSDKAAPALTMLISTIKRIKGSFHSWAYISNVANLKPSPLLSPADYCCTKSLISQHLFSQLPPVKCWHLAW